MTHKLHLNIVLALVVAIFGLTLALPTLAHGDDDGHNTATTTAREARKDRMKIKMSSSTVKERKNGSTTKERNVDLTCMQTAVDTREASLMTALSSFHDDLEAGLTARKSALHDAWGITTVAERNKALVSAWKTWKTTHKEAFGDLRSTRKSSWDTFKSTVKTTCKETLPKDEALQADTAGSVAI